MTQPERPQKLPPTRPGPKGGKRDQNRQRRTAELLQSALTLFLERGVEGASVGEIAKGAGQAKGSFYRYFDDKLDLVRALIAPVREALEEGFASCRAALLVAKGERAELFLAYSGLGLGLALLVEEYPDLARLYLQESRGKAQGAREPLCALGDWIVTAAIELTVLAQDQGLLRPVPPQVSALAVIGASERLLQEHLQGRLEDSENVVGALVGLVLEGLVPG